MEKQAVKISLNKERLKYFLIGAMVAFVIIVLSGASDTHHPSPVLNYGRYQLSSWGSSLGNDSGAFGAFVTDTVSGETKLVYARIYGSPGKGKAAVDNLRKSFSAMD